MRAHKVDTGSETPSGDTPARRLRALISLAGLSVGDAFGEQFFGPEDLIAERISERSIPPPVWPYTDDTAMTLSVVDVLMRFGRIDQDALAAALVERHEEEPDRGYGAGVRQLLRAASDGAAWRDVAAAAFGGRGSHGNGAAMRVAPIGAWFADDINRAVAEARASAEVTHTHEEAVAGAVAVALAAAYAVLACLQPEAVGNTSLLAFVETHIPPGETRHGIRKALAMPEHTSVAHAANVLGSGHRISAADTVPFALWCAARHLGNYEEALWTTVSGLGDRDTTCAIVGGIVVLRTGMEAIPERWLHAREKLEHRYNPALGDDEAFQ
ncbi:MAG TPA: ADP-ribosylglycohydrolase family protein [Candidatus Kapabacteria bacterium]|nr:ADP-ribosylglycohydrolase family protein [Candidatus Kapabacteria bacterium]